MNKVDNNGSLCLKPYLHFNQFEGDPLTNTTIKQEDNK